MDERVGEHHLGKKVGFGLAKCLQSGFLGQRTESEMTSRIFLLHRRPGNKLSTSPNERKFGTSANMSNKKIVRWQAKTFP